MDKLLLILLFACGFFSTELSAQSHGLIFSSFEVEKEKRTTLDLSSDGPVCVAEKGDLSFELSFISGYTTYFGYVFRLINEHNQNIDLLFNPKTNHFYLVWKENYTPINFAIDSSALWRQWSVFRLHREGTKLLFFVNERLMGQTSVELQDDCFKLFFGACNFREFKTTDIPPMRIRNVRISQEGRSQYYWPINEYEGTVCTDSLRGKKGAVINPVWIAPQHAKWKLVRSFTGKGNVSAAFDPVAEQLYVLSLDSVYRYTARNENLRSIAVNDKKEYLGMGAQSFVNPFNGQLYYLFVEHHKASRFDLVSGHWTDPADSADLTEYWQANKFVASSNNSLYILGGYGQLKYKNDVQRMDLTNDTWQKVTPQGDFFSPRYLAALGTTPTGDTAYIIGGYGSTTGAQELSPKYMYDLLMYDVKRNSFKKMVTLNPGKEPFVFGNSLVLDPAADGDYYALTFPNDRFNSVLQLIKGNIHSSGYIPVADTIPYSFNDIQSYADLYYCRQSQQLLVVTLLRKLNTNTSEVKIYSLAFPPNEQPLVIAPAARPARTIYIGIAAGVLLLLLVAVMYRKRIVRQKARIQPAAANGQLEAAQAKAPVAATIATTQEPPLLPTEGQPAGPAILLFGAFEVIDRDNNNITRLFTPLLQELFLLITIFTAKTGHGVPTAELNEILWKNKSEKDAKNNRSVNLAKLKTILEKLGNCSISKESERWVFKSDPEIRIDLVDFLHITNSKHRIEKASVEQLLNIIKRGSFLSQVEYTWLDDIKSDISNRALDMLVEAGNSLQPETHAEQMIEIANFIFQFDRVNEHALALKCKGLTFLGRHSLAKNAYEKFAKDYKHMYGEDFSQTYTSVITD